MAEVGRLAVWVALVAGGAAVVGRRRWPLTVAVGAAGVATVVLAWALVDNDYSLVYVADFSRRGASAPYRLAALWGGMAGSLLWFATLAGAAGWWAAGRVRSPSARGVVAAVTGGLVAALAGLVLAFADPFRRLQVPAIDGGGLTPILEHPAMLYHPPLLYLGLATLTGPFALTVAGLLGRADAEADADWPAQVRRWLVVPWTPLAAGMLAGAHWAYVELGWGGYWAWDPVENTALLPWLAVTLALHTTVHTGRESRQGEVLASLATVRWMGTVDLDADRPGWVRRSLHRARRRLADTWASVDPTRDRHQRSTWRHRWLHGTRRSGPGDPASPATAEVDVEDRRVTGPGSSVAAAVDGGITGREQWHDSRVVVAEPAGDGGAGTGPPLANGGDPPATGGAARGQAATPSRAPSANGGDPPTAGGAAVRQGAMAGEAPAAAGGAAAAGSDPPTAGGAAVRQGAMAGGAAAADSDLVAAGGVAVGQGAMVCVAFLLALTGTMLTRSGAVSSVHAFAESQAIGRALGALVVATAGGVAVLLGRSLRSAVPATADPAPAATGEGDRGLAGQGRPMAPMALVAAGVGGRGLVGRLVVGHFVVVGTVLGVATIGTLAPLVTDLRGGDGIAIEGRYFASFAGPLAAAGLVLVALVPVGLRLVAARGEVVVAGAGAALGLGALYAAGGDIDGPVVVLGGAAGAALLSAVGGGLRAQRQGRSVAAHVAHAGIGLLLLGVAGTTSGTTETLPVAPGERVEVLGQTVEYRGVEVVEDVANGGGRVEGASAVVADVHAAGHDLRPELVAYPAIARVIAETSLVSTPWRDVQVGLRDAADDGQAVLQIGVHPLQVLVWWGGLVLIAAGVLSAVEHGRRRSVP